MWIVINEKKIIIFELTPPSMSNWKKSLWCVPECLKSCLTELQKFKFSGERAPFKDCVALQQPTLAMQVYFNSSVFSVLSSILFYNDNLNNFYQGPTQLVYIERIESSWLPKHTSLKKTALKDWLKRMLWFTIYLSMPHVCISHTIYSMVYRKSGSVSSRKEKKFRQEHYICIKKEECHTK